MIINLWSRGSCLIKKENDAVAGGGYDTHLGGKKNSCSWLLSWDQGLISWCWLRSHLLAVITPFFPLCQLFHFASWHRGFSAGCGPAGDSMQLCPCARVLVCVLLRLTLSIYTLRRVPAFLSMILFSYNLWIHVKNTIKENYLQHYFPCHTIILRKSGIAFASLLCKSLSLFFFFLLHQKQSFAGHG